MPKLGLAFRLLERGETKALIELCPEVHDAPWSSLTEKERDTLRTTHEFLEQLARLGLVKADHPEGVTVLPSSLPQLRYYRLDVVGHKYVNLVVESAIYTLRQKKALHKHLEESA